MVVREEDEEERREKEREEEMKRFIIIIIINHVRGWPMRTSHQAERFQPGRLICLWSGSALLLQQWGGELMMYSMILNESDEELYYCRYYYTK